MDDYENTLTFWGSEIHVLSREACRGSLGQRKQKSTCGRGMNSGEGFGEMKSSLDKMTSF